ncbi:bifunctional demethylmenaquinone methyltransferase/2-methoxy-6-polyprenyl-1,4-benzoquinol methylase UbiE [bacterium]|nr:bifunctional demethylmenaquinone methyltransferase/2-methoxy-6-polyprenyl-1,4-benzoquinol methylase UbiE [bacterium]
MNLLKTPKQHLVHKVFASIVERYELLNTILSMGQDAYWRKAVAKIADLKSNQIAIDLCTGTGSLAIELVKHIDTVSEGAPLTVVGIDFCDEMLSKARKKLDNPQIKGNVEFVNGLAEDIPFADNTFDCATIAFGLRNVENIQRTFSEMQRVVKPEGKIISLELVIPSSPIIRCFYYPYLKWILPFIGRLISKTGIPYQYLSDSISGFMSAQDLANIMISVGLKDVGWHNLSCGVAAIHVGCKLVSVQPSAISGQQISYHQSKGCLSCQP